MAIEKSKALEPNAEEVQIELPVSEDTTPPNIIIEGQETAIEIVPDTGTDFNQNLAEIISEDDLGTLSSGLIDDYEDD